MIPPRQLSPCPNVAEQLLRAIPRLMTHRTDLPRSARSLVAVSDAAFAPVRAPRRSDLVAVGVPLGLIVEPSDRGRRDGERWRGVQPVRMPIGGDRTVAELGVSAAL